MCEKGSLIVISGPSGVGKSTVISRVMHNYGNCVFSVSATTRAPREGEKHAVDYYFIKRDRFEKMIESEDLFEHAEYVGNLYGTPKAPVFESISNGKNVIFDIEVKGAFQIKNQCPEAILVFIIPPNFAQIEKRLRGRGTDSEKKILGRLDTAKREMARASEYDYIVLNDNPDNAANEIEAIITAERCKAENRKNILSEVCLL